MESPLDGDQATADGGLAPFGGAPAAPEPGPGEGARPPAATLDPSLAARLRELPRAEDVRFAVWRPAGAGPRVAGGDAGEAGAPLEPGAAPAGAAPRATPADPLEDFFYREGEDPGPFTALAGAPPVEDRPAGPGVLEEYLTFLLGGDEYAIAIERVREVLRCPPVTEVPRASADVRGVVTVRGDVVAVLDPRRRLGLAASPAAAAPARLVIVDAGDGPCGLLVDAISSVVRLEAGSVEPCPQGLSAAVADCVAGVGRQHDRLFTVLDLAALLRRAVAPRRAAVRGRDA